MPSRLAEQPHTGTQVIRGLLLCMQPHTATPSRLQQQHIQADRRPEWLNITADQSTQALVDMHPQHTFTSRVVS